MSKEDINDTIETIEHDADDTSEAVNDEERALRIDAICQLAKSGELEVPAEMEEIIEAFVHTIEQRDENQAKLIRAIADHQNFQRRAALNEREARTSATQGVVQGLIPLLDQFDMALLLDPEKVTAQTVIDGVKMTRDEFVRILNGYGVSAISPEVGDEFEPGIHEAMMQQAAEGVEPGHIAFVMSVGYKLGERVIRPAKVGVVPTPESDASEQDSEES